MMMFRMHLPACWPAAVAVVVLAYSIGLAGAQPAAVAPAIGARLAAAGDAGAGATAEETAAARRFYAPVGNVPAWSAPDDTRTALRLLESAAQEGLEPDDYDIAVLRELLEQRTRDSVAAARFDIALTVVMLRYLSDLRCGRTRGTVLSYRPGEEHACDVGEVLRKALTERRLATLPVDAASSLAVYARLRAALQGYREHAARGDTGVSRASAQAALSVIAGDVPAAAPLRRRLVELGDLPLDSSAAEAADSAAGLPAALKRFQHRHGLQEDGIPGPATLAALNVPLRQRVRQIALAMERLRWLPPLPDRRVVAINVPSFRLWAFDRAVHAAEPVLDMRVIVGRAMRTPTPVFVGNMRYLEFSPYWNVPASILRSEIVPRLASDPGYLRRHHMEVVQANVATQDVTTATLAGLRSGSSRVRQRPGPANALGPVKFALPNPMNIYLHGTPARELFDAARRDFSHGCIRVESPAALAQFVLGDAAVWSEAAVKAAMSQGTTRVVPLEVPLPVVIFYTTAVPEVSGSMTFLDDVYGLDAALEQRWKRLSPVLPAAPGAVSAQRALARVSGHGP